MIFVSTWLVLKPRILYSAGSVGRVIFAAGGRDAIMFSEVASAPGAAGAFGPIVVSKEGSTCRYVQIMIADCQSKKQRKSSNFSDPLVWLECKLVCCNKYHAWLEEKKASTAYIQSHSWQANVEPLELRIDICM